jgi:hypothetical protein
MSQREILLFIVMTITNTQIKCTSHAHIKPDGTQSNHRTLQALARYLKAYFIFIKYFLYLPKGRTASEKASAEAVNIISIATDV